MPSVQTRRNVPAWEHPNTIISYGGENLVDVDGEKIIVPDSNIVIAPDDHILLIATFRPKSSGWQITDHHNPSSTGAVGEKEFSFGPHKQGLFNGINPTTAEALSGYGRGASNSFEARAYCAYIDREITERQYIIEAVTDYDASAKDPDYIPAYYTMREDLLVGTDDGFGAYTIPELAFVGMQEIGVLRIIRWAAGNAPPLEMMRNALLFTWFEWCSHKRFRVYPPLTNFV